MPKVTDEYREARRDEIARAAVRCLERKGVRDTSIADIVEESGLSTGAIYSHFSNKAELARYVAGRFLFPRVDALEQQGAAGVVITPRQALEGMLTALTTTGIKPELILQFWAEAMADADLRQSMMRTVDHLRTSFGTAVTPWAREHTTSEDDAARLAAESARSISALAQGYIANTAVFGPRPFSEYLRGSETVLTS
ncbi:MAG: TetR/AcrR family transcriptional regulator [Microbacteriaceae bacterium]